MITLITNPATEDTHYGIPVCHIGEDGNMLALGHPGKRKALAAFNRHARVFCRLVNLADDRSARLTDWTDAVTEEWVVFTQARPRQRVGRPGLRVVLRRVHGRQPGCPARDHPARRIGDHRVMTARLRLTAIALVLAFALPGLPAIFPHS